MANAMRPKIMFGIQTDISGGIDPFSANVRNSVKNKINTKESTNPREICKPVPPRVLRADTINPMKTSLKMVTGDGNRLFLCSCY
jgi:hypothetical protein